MSAVDQSDLGAMAGVPAAPSGAEPMRQLEWSKEVEFHCAAGRSSVARQTGVGCAAPSSASRVRQIRLLLVVIIPLCRVVALHRAANRELNARVVDVEQDQFLLM